MQVFRELYIRGEPDQLAATTEAICESLSGDWSRDAESEERIREEAFSDDGQAYSFMRKKQGQRRAVNLYLMWKDNFTLWVSNIVPREVSQLSYDEYNGVMEEFFDLFIRPAVARTGAQVTMTDAEADLEQWVSPETAKKLRLFCWTANKSTGSSHPADRERWFDFIISAHREGSDLDSTTLGRWLGESGGWNEDGSLRLAIEYEFAKELLTQADKQTVGV